MMVPPVSAAPPVQQAQDSRGNAIFAGVAVAIVLFGGFIIAMQSRETAQSSPVESVAPTSTPVRVAPPATIGVSPASSTSAPTIPTIREFKATDLPISTAKKPNPQQHVVVRPPVSNDPPKTGLLTIICMPACDQVMDGAKSLGPTPIFKRTAVVGTHHLTLRGEDGTKKTVNVDVAEGETAVVKQPM